MTLTCLNMRWISVSIPVELICGDCLEIMRSMDDASVDLVFGSPPYEDARTYGIDFGLAGEEWVAWMVDVVKEAVRVSRGLVGFVVEGRTRGYRYSATPALLMADLHRAGMHLRKPPIFRRYGIPGSGGPDWLRNEYEFVFCASRPGKLAWSDNTACGRPLSSEERQQSVVQTRRCRNGERSRDIFKQPERTTRGNVIDCGSVGNGTQGSSLAYENEAPFPEKLVEVFVRSFCPPGGTVLDPFSGSGTTAAVAVAWGRQAIGIDVRQSQIDLARRRLDGVQREMFV